MYFDAYNRSLDLLRTLAPLLDRLASTDAKLADQLRRASTSVTLNIAEGNRRRGKDRTNRFRIALGSAAEVGAALEAAVALAYLADGEVAAAAGCFTTVGSHRIARRRLGEAGPPIAPHQRPRGRRGALERVLPTTHALSMPPTFAEAIHLVFSDSAMGCLLAAGARRPRIHGSGDQLTSGPCDVDPVRHEELRQAWDTERGHMLGSSHRLGLERLRTVIAGDEPVVLWGTRAFSDLVWLWWALDRLRRIGAEGPRFFLARPHPDDPLMTVGSSTPDEARIALPAARPITDDEWREGGELWIKYASSSPLAFDEARRKGSSVFPELISSAELHGAWFPRFTDGRLRLSELDAVLLGGVGESWLTTSDLLRTLPMDRFARLAWPFDDFFPIDRLRAWATHGVLEREALADENPWAQDRFRATERSRALLDHGLGDVGDAPQLHVGGCLVNDPTSPWARIEDDSGWRLALQGRP
jgi:four helix bundle protein